MPDQHQHNPQTPNPTDQGPTEPSLDQLLAVSPDRLADYLGTVTVPRVPTVLALYDADDEPAGVIGWVLSLPDGAAMIVNAANPRDLVYATSLESVADRWAARLGGDLTAVAAA